MRRADRYHCCVCNRPYKWRPKKHSCNSALCKNCYREALTKDLGTTLYKFFDTYSIFSLRGKRARQFAEKLVTLLSWLDWRL